MREAVAAVLGAERAERFFERLLDRFFGDADARVARRRSASTACGCRSTSAISRRRAPFDASRGGFRAARRGDPRAAATPASTASSTCTRCPAARTSTGTRTTRRTSPRSGGTRTSRTASSASGCARRALRRQRRGWRATTCSTSPPIRPARSSGRCTTGSWRRSARSIPTTSCSSTATPTRRTSRPSASRTRTRSTPATTTPRRDGVRRYPGVTRADRPRGAGGEVPASARAYQRETGTPIWVGEFGPVYTGDPELDEQRYQVLADQLEIYDALRRRLVAVDLQGRRAAGARLRGARQRLHAPLRRLHRQEGAPRRRLLGLDRPRAARPGRADPRVDRARVPGLGAVPVERALLDRRHCCATSCSPRRCCPSTRSCSAGSPTRSSRRSRTRSASRVRAPRAPVRPRRRHTRGVAQPLKTVAARNCTAFGSCALIRIVSQPRTPTRDLLAVLERDRSRSPCRA